MPAISLFTRAHYWRRTCRYLGVLDAIRVRRVGYPVRRTFDEVVRAFIELTGNRVAATKRMQASKHGARFIAADICTKGDRLCAAFVALI